MRILLDYRPALRQRTGVGAYIHETARALAATAPPGETLTLFSASWRDRLAPASVAPLAVVDRQIPVRLLNRAWHRWEWPPIERLAGPCDVAQSAHPLLLPARHAAQVVTVHDLAFLDHPERTRAEIKRDYPSLAPSHARRADQVIAVSTHTAAEVQTRFGVPSSHITICPPGAPEWSPRPGLPTHDPCILFLGTLEPRKNLDVLLDAYARLITTHPSAPPLVLAGRASSGVEDVLKRLETPPLAGRVRLPGYVSETDKRMLFDRAVLFVLPSHTEGFGIPAVEAMAAGVPVVVADRGALPETVGDAGVRFDPDRADDLLQALTGVVHSPERQWQLREAGLAQVRRFTWSHTASRTREAWHLALEHRRGRG